MAEDIVDSKDDSVVIKAGTLLDEAAAWVERHHAYRSTVFWAEGFHLYSSHLGDGPSRYVAEADYVLG